MKKTTFKVLSLSFFGLLAFTVNSQTIKKCNNVQQFGKIIIPAQELTPSGHIRCYKF